MDNSFNYCGLHKISIDTAEKMIHDFDNFNTSGMPKRMIPDMVFLSKLSLEAMLVEMEEASQNCVQLRLGLLEPPKETAHLSWLMRPVQMEELEGRKYRVTNEGSWYASESTEVLEPEPPGVQNPPYSEQ